MSSSGRSGVGGRRLARAVVLALGACMMGTSFAAEPPRRSQFAGRVDFDAVAPVGGHDRFILYYDDASPLAEDPVALTAELGRAARRLPAGLTLEPGRRLGTGG